MGVQGLTTLLQKHSKPRVVCFKAGEADGLRAKVLLVDASAVQYSLLDKIGSHKVDWKTPSFHASLYHETCRFYRGLQATGLRCVLILDSACPPQHEETYVARRQDSARQAPPTASMVMMQAYKDLGLQVEHSVHDADTLLLAWYHQYQQDIFAVLTNDSDFYVYGVREVVHVEDIVVDLNSATFHLWNTASAWQGLQRASRRGALGGAMHTGLIQRAQVAAILGNDSNKRMRRHLEARSTQQAAAGARVVSPNVAAREVLLAGRDSLDLAFFHGEPLNMRGLTQEHLALFNEVVAEYVKHDRQARSPGAADSLRLSIDNLPWLSASLAERLTQLPVPSILTAFACRGFGCLAVPGEFWAPAQAVRAAAAQLLGTPLPVHEYCPSGNSLHRLAAPAAAAGGGAASPLLADWFDPARHLPDLEVTAVAAGGDAEVTALRRGSMRETMHALHQAFPKLSLTLGMYYALLLHVLDLEGDMEAYAAAARQLLLPGVPLPAAEQAAEAEDEEGAPAADAAKVVDVGSSLTKGDWEDIDNKEVVAQVKSSSGYKLMLKIQQWDMEQAVAVASYQLPADRLFPLFYKLYKQDDGPSKLWKALVRACFPEQYAELDGPDGKARKKEITASTKDALMQALKAQKDPAGVYTCAWVEALQAFAEAGAGNAGSAAGQQAAAERLLVIWRHAAVAGPGSPQWNAAQVCWEAASPAVKRAGLDDMWAYPNAGALPTGGPPMRYPHQQELLDAIDEHLEAIEAHERKLSKAKLAGKGKEEDYQALAAQAPLPLHIILSTPTGSGKTFTAVMMHLQLMRPALGEGHPDFITVYSVPTKQVLKRVGQDCEAHGVVYWTAAKDGDVHQVRRPYSIRTQRGGGSIGAGSMRDQLDRCSEQGAKCCDRGGGKPDFIVADIHSTLALVRAAAAASPDSWYHSSRLVLYFDEPNMGIHLDGETRDLVRGIMAAAPATTILASATMPSWDRLPAWWRTQQATRRVIKQEPYSLPASRLEVLSASRGVRTPVNVLQLFSSHAQYASALGASQRLRVLLLRHLAPKQANELLLGAAAGDAEAQEAVAALGQDVRSLREAVEPALADLDEATFTRLRQAWSGGSTPAADGIKSVLSKQGVTMVATLDARTRALEVAGKFSDPVGWAQAVREVRGKVSAAASSQKTLAKEARRTQRKGDDDAPPGDAPSAGGVTVTLRTGLWVSVEEAESTEEDVLVMLSRGVAYACCGGTEPMVKRLYQQALLYIPDKAKQPPLNVLVVDYSSIYGTDCQSVDTIVLCEDLGSKLSWEDHQQFIGRLRRDGTAVYPSLDMLRWATTGIRSAVEAEEAAAVAEVLQRHGAQPAAPDTTPAAGKELLALVTRQQAAGSDASRADVARHALRAALRSLFVPASTTYPDVKALYKAAVVRLQRWGGAQPATLIGSLLRQVVADEAALVSELERICLEPPTRATVNANAATLLAAAPYLLKWLFDEEVISKEGVIAWADQPREAQQADGRFRQAVAVVVQGVREYESDSEEEESDEE